MSDSKSSLRIDWFDGTLIEDTRQNATSSSQFDDEDKPETQTKLTPKDVEKKPIGFKRLFDLSHLKPSILTLEISHRPGFWHLLDIDLKGDFIVLIIKILSTIYSSLEDEEKSKIVTLLRTRFLKSVFIINLKTYLGQLPNVRIVEKKMNMQLWDDIETFYLNMFVLCEGMSKFHSKENDVLFEVLELLEITETSAVGVREEHMETIRDSFFTQIDQKDKDIIMKINQETNNCHSISKQVNEDPSHYKNLKIFPTKEDLLGDSKIKIKPNIINGAYSSIEHYLDVQFKLLREDCFAPLREGICKYMENPSKRRHENIRVYPKVRIIRTYVSNNKVGHLVDIAWQDRLDNGSTDKKQYAHSKKLMFGSLLLFTSDQFETVLCASVLDSNQRLLADGYIVVSFESLVSNKIYDEAYLMVESEVYFEPYHRVLKVLQNMRTDDMPMKEYIVYVQAEPKPPKYLTSDTIYSILDVNNKEISFPVLDTEKWPSSECLGLDEYQMSAYQFALTRQFAVIQGPPGTGKTFIGIKIASTLLKNLSLEGTPMLIICYTNHALDQFLEGILHITKNIIRFGSQSKSEILQSYTLHNMKSRVKSKYSYLYANKKAELERVYKEMMEVQTEIEKCEKEIVSYKTLKPYLKIGDKSYELKTTNEDSILSWLFNHLEEENDDISENNDLDDWEKQCEDLNINDKVETCFSEEWVLNEIQTMNKSIEYVKDLTDDAIESDKMVAKFEKQITKLRNRLKYFKQNMSSLRKVKQMKDVPEIGNLYELTPDKRWMFYFKAVAALKDKLNTKMNELLERERRCCAEVREVSALVEAEVCGGARVLALTTSAAARRHRLLQTLRCNIVLVEEAAEVLEGHVVAALTDHCQHLILIEDSWSHRNSWEAVWCVSLANYLRHMRYTADDVTVLTTYSAQANLITELSKKYAALRDVKVRVVDKYQGEESRIVILSLVRSNKDGNIGFLAQHNRICVAMSRAREGFYIFGNMDVLKSASTIWASIADKLKEQNALGRSIVLRCETHQHVTYQVERSEDFDSSLYVLTEGLGAYPKLEPLKMLRSKFHLEKCNKAPIKHNPDFVLDNFVEAEMKSVLRPLYLAQYLSLAPKYSIRYDLITSNSHKFNVFVCLCAVGISTTWWFSSVLDYLIKAEGMYAATVFAYSIFFTVLSSFFHAFVIVQGAISMPVWKKSLYAAQLIWIKNLTLVAILCMESENIHLKVKNAQVACIVLCARERTSELSQLMRRQEQWAGPERGEGWLRAAGLFSVDAALPPRFLAVLGTYIVAILQLHFL
ncbi:NFX1-type zinc finger-containing protein 1 [Papilio machaon]|uniref:NFX1-type zinc finger-containing protein 1 n=1 Tax=Papilio machaon TaxID=76193 RepID=A0A194RGS3_PAPMA|nr:NFX1-type zinc finger-containing protein 1 [Papilio machaon]